MPSGLTVLDAYTTGGVHVLLRVNTGEPVAGQRCTWADTHLEIDGKPVRIDAYMLMRDGGTRIYRTAQGNLVFPHRIDNPDRTPRFNGNPVIVPAAHNRTSDAVSRLLDAERKRSLTIQWMPAEGGAPARFEVIDVRSGDLVAQAVMDEHGGLRWEVADGARS